MKKFIFIYIFIYSLDTFSQHFTNIAPQNNINFSLTSTDGYGSGVSFYDFDNDGWDDLTLCRENDSILFYKNVSGTYTLLPSFIYGYGEVKTVLWVDYDNDGDNDLFTCSNNGLYYLYNNDGNFIFTDVSIDAGFNLTPSKNYGACFGDYNKDGFLDLYICRYFNLPTGDSTSTVETNILYKNNGNGTFTDLTMEAGVSDGLKPSFQSVFFDYNKDGWPDIYVINDRIFYKNGLYRNDGNGHFTDVSNESGAAVQQNNPMSNTIGDFNNDTFSDIYMSNTGEEGIRGLLLKNNTDNTFSEIGEEAGVAIPQLSWGSSFFDYDNNGFLDLYVTTSENVHNYFYKNSEGIVFNESSDIFLEHTNNSCYSVANGDVNNDGYSDLLVLCSNGFNSELWQNSGASSKHIKITCTGTVSNRMAIGTTIRVFVNGNEYYHYTLCGENYLSQNSQHHIFGVNDNTIIDSVYAEYLSGIVDKYYNLKTNQHYYFIEGETYSNHISYIGNTTFCEGDSIILDAGEYNSYLWNDGDTSRFKSVYQSGSYQVQVQNNLGLTIQSDTIHIEVVSPPLINITTNHPSCYGFNDGKITLNLNSITNYSITWSNGINSDSLSNLVAGTYHFTYSDNFNCQLNDSVMLIEPYELNYLYKIEHFTDTSFGQFEIVVFGGTPPYSFFLNSIPANNIINNLNSGDYNLLIVDNNNCQLETQFTVLDYSTNQITHLKPENILVYPNPTIGNILYYESALPVNSVAVYDFSGRKYPAFLNNHTIELPNDLLGFLMVEFEINGYKFYKKINRL